MSQQAAAPVSMGAPGATPVPSGGGVASAIAGAGMEPGAGYEGYGSGAKQPGVNNMNQDQMQAMLKGAGTLNSFASILGKTPEEREANAKAFAALTKDVGNAVKDMSESTLMQRMMEHSMSGPSYLDTGTSPSGGVAAIPKTFDPAMAAQIMNRFGFR